MELNDFQKSKYYYEHFYKPIRAITKCYDPQDENQKHKNNHEKENGDQNKRTIKRYVKENKVIHSFLLLDKVFLICIYNNN